MLQKYKAMADIVAGEIKTAMTNANLNELFLNQEQGFKSLLIEQAALFQGEVGILDTNGHLIKGQENLSNPIFLTFLPV